MAGSSLLAGVSGLQSHQDMLDVVGNNLANINTTGFKYQRTEFADLLYQTIKPGTGANGNVGGTDPLQIGRGVQVGRVSQILSQGSLESTGGAFDVALEGNGFFVVSNGGENLFTRAGAFDVDSNGFLVDPSTGARVQRFGTLGEGSATAPVFQTPGDNNISVPYGTAVPGLATKNIALQGNLSATATGALAQTLTSAHPFLAGSTAATGATLLNSLDDKQVDYVTGDSIRIQGTTASGGTVNTTLSVDGTTTLGDVLTAINSAFPGSTASLDAAGNIVITANTPGPNSSLELLVSDAAGNTGVGDWSNHTFPVTTAGKSADTVNTSIQVFDTQGTPHTISLTFRKAAAANVWDMTALIVSSEGTMTDNLVSGITFNADGSFRQISGTGTGDPFITFQVNGLAAAQTVGFSFGSSNAFNGLTQFGGTSSAAAKSQDGYGPGFLSNVSIARDGIMNGVFSNGQILPIAQLAIATFNNPGGLNRDGDNRFRLSTDSGIALLGPGLSDGRGSVVQGALESSNVDVAAEFTRLIIAQRGFQVNAKTITTSNEVLQDLVSIIR